MVWPPGPLPVAAPKAEPWRSSTDAASDTTTAMARALFRMGSPLGGLARSNLAVSPPARRQSIFRQASSNAVLRQTAADRLEDRHTTANESLRDPDSRSIRSST